MSDYPTSTDLRRVRRWGSDWPGLLAFVRSIWWMPEWGWHQQGNVYRVSTGGWSGNEDIIDALERNAPFWSACFRSGRVGGHYRFSTAMKRTRKAQSA